MNTGARGRPARGPGHIPALDGVRGLAIFLLLMHQLVLPAQLTSPPARILEHVLQVGWIGVQLFFVLSGFLITSVLLDTKGREGYFRAFYVRRVLRIFPLYYLLLVTVSVASRQFSVPEILRAEPWQMRLYWVYLSNWSLEGPSVLGSCWSLAVEEQFYLVWPWLVGMLASRRLLWLCMALAVASLALRIGLRNEGVSPEVLYENTLTRMDALVLGAAGAVLSRDPGVVSFLRPRLRSALALGAAAFVGATMTRLARTGALTQTIGYSLLALSFTVVVVVAVIQQTTGDGGLLARALSARPLRTLGTYSYGIYILQLPMHLLVSRVLIPDLGAYRDDSRYLVVQSAYFVGMLGVLFGLAVLSYHLYEKRFLALKRYFQVK